MLTKNETGRWQVGGIGTKFEVPRSASSTLQEAPLLPPEERAELCEEIWGSLREYRDETLAEFQQRVEDVQLHP